jgi:hypothetical protein
VGNDGETLVADSSASVGLRYSATPSASNPILNSAMQIWQRGTSFTIASGVPTYFADRFQITRFATGATGTRQVTGDTTNLPFIQYCARVARDSGNTSNAPIYLTYSMDSVNSIPFAGKTITFSYYARRGANYSATSNNLGLTFGTGTGTDQNINAGYTGSAAANFTVSLTTTWQRFTHQVTIGSNVTEMGFYFEYTSTGTAGAADFFEMTGFQIDIGSVALPFRTTAATIQGELSACQRYYEKSYSTATAPGTNTGTGSISTGGTSNGGNNLFSNIFFAVEKRAVPTLTSYTEAGTSGQAYYERSGASGSVTATAYNVSTRRANLYVGTGAAWTASIIVHHYVAESEL